MSYNIKSERIRAGLTREQVAEAVGVHPNSVRNWEQNLCQPGSNALIAMSTLFGCSADYLLGLTDERSLRSSDQTVA